MVITVFLGWISISLCIWVERIIYENAVIYSLQKSVAKTLVSTS